MLVLLIILMVSAIILILIFGILVLKKTKGLENQTGSTDSEKYADYKSLYNEKKTELETLTNEKNSLSEQIKTILETKIETNFEEQIKANKEQIENFQKSIEDINKLFLGNTKKVGTLSETILERMLNYICNVDIKGAVIKRQQRDLNNKIPDLIIESDNNIFPKIVIDSKFPVDSWSNYLISNQNELEKRSIVKVIQEHVKDISKKYVHDDVPFAIMFTPLEDMIQVLSSDDSFNFGQDQKIKEKGSLNFLEYCMSKRIIPVSPTTIIGVLTTLERYFNLFEKLDNADEKIQKISIWMSKHEKLIKEFMTLKNTITKLTTDYDKIITKFNELNKASGFIEKKEIE